MRESLMWMMNLAVVVVVAGCGGDGRGEPVTPPSIAPGFYSGTATGSITCTGMTMTSGMASVTVALTAGPGNLPASATIKNNSGGDADCIDIPITGSDSDGDLLLQVDFPCQMDNPVPQIVTGTSTIIPGSLVSAPDNGIEVKFEQDWNWFYTNGTLYMQCVHKWLGVLGGAE